MSETLLFERKIRKICKNQRKSKLKHPLITLNTVYIALGSNQNNPIYHVQKGIREINHLMHTKVLKKSSLYISAPIGIKNQPDYINCLIYTTPSPRDATLSRMTTSA